MFEYTGYIKCLQLHFLGPSVVWCVQNLHRAKHPTKWITYLGIYRQLSSILKLGYRKWFQQAPQGTAAVCFPDLPVLGAVAPNLP